MTPNMNIFKTIISVSARLAYWTFGAGLFVCLLAACVLTRDQGAELRATPAYVALSAFDPFLWECARNSCLVAASVSAIAVSCVLVASMFAPTSRRVPRALRAPAVWPVAIPPFFVALGIRSLASFGFPDAELVPGPFAWGALVAVELIWAIPLAYLIAAPTLGPELWRDAARLAAGGTGVRRAWNMVVRAGLRPALWSAAAFIFLVTLAEPAAPLVFDIERVLSVVVVCGLASARTDQGVAVIGAAISIVGLTAAWGLRAFMGSGAGRQWIRLDHCDSAVRSVDRRDSAAGSVVAWLGMTAWLLVAWSPIAALLVTTVRDIGATPVADGARVETTVLTDAANYGVWRCLSGSIQLAACATGLAILVALAICASRSSFSRSGRLWPRVPMFVAGIAAFAAVAGLATAVQLDSHKLQWVRVALLVSTLAWVLVPGVVGALDSAAASTDQSRGDFVRLSGGGRLRAWWHAGGARFCAALACAAFGGFVLVAFESAALLLFARGGGLCTLGPAAFELAQTAGASTLANLIGLAGIAAACFARALGSSYGWFGPVVARSAGGREPSN